MKRFSLRLKKELHELLRKESFETEKSINEIVTKLIEDKYKENKKMEEKKLLKKIEKIIEKKYYAMGHMGNEIINFTIKLTDEEKETFSNMELSENYRYDLDRNNLNINYSEEI